MTIKSFKKMCLLDSDGGIFVTASVNGQDWFTPLPQERLFGDWETKSTPCLASYLDTLYMSLTDADGRVYVTQYDTAKSTWKVPVFEVSYLFNDWRTYEDDGYATPLLLSLDQLYMVLLDEEGRIYSSYLQNDGTWAKPPALVKGIGYKTKFTPSVAITDNGLLLCLTNEDGYIKLFTGKSIADLKEINPESTLFNTTRTYQQRPPAVIWDRTRKLIHMTFVNDEHRVMTVAWNDSNDFKQDLVAKPVFANDDWSSDFAPTLFTLGGTVFMCICDRNGRIYISPYEYDEKNQVGQWKRPPYPHGMFGSWETFRNKTPEICTFVEAVSSSGSLKTWMLDINDNTSLVDMTLPGTHDTFTYNCLPTDTMSITQSLSFEEQLNAGVRYFDIRALQNGDDFKLMHGIDDLRLDFSEVYPIAQSFLVSNPSETLIFCMDSSGDYDETDWVKTLKSFFAKPNQDGKATPWFIENRIPSLKEVRGEIILFRRFIITSSETLGLDLSNGWNNSPLDTITVPNGTVYIQDDYEVPTIFNRPQKWQRIYNMFEYARTRSLGTALYMNFTNGASTGAYPDMVAAYINPRVLEYLNSHKPQNHFGVVAMDFITDVFTSMIIQNNFVPPQS